MIGSQSSSELKKLRSRTPIGKRNVRFQCTLPNNESFRGKLSVSACRPLVISPFGHKMQGTVHHLLW